MPGWLFWTLWLAAALSGLLRAAYRFRKYGAVRPIQAQRAIRFGRSRPVRLTSQSVKLNSQIELAVWAMFVCGGLAFGLIKVLI